MIRLFGYPNLDSYRVALMVYSGGTEGMNSFAERLKKVRQDRKYTQQQLADIIKVSAHSISNYEQGVCEPSSMILLDLAQVLDVTPEFLLKGVNDMNKYTSAIKAELMQLKEYEQISEIKDQDLNATILAHLEMSEDLIQSIKNQWNSASIFKREEVIDEEVVLVDSYCTRNYVQEVIIRYCQNRTMFKEKFSIRDGMLMNV